MSKFSMSGNSFCFSSDQSTYSSTSDASSSLFSNKRQMDDAFHSSPSSSSLNTGIPPSISSYREEWTNSRSGYSNTYRGAGGYGRFSKRSRPYNYQN